MFEWYEDEVRGLEQRETMGREATLAPPVVFYGSSSIRLWNTLQSDFDDVPVVNLGFGGSTLAACAYFFRRLVPPANGRALVAYAGDNDLGDGASAAQVAENFFWFQSQVNDILGSDHSLLFLSIKPSPARLALTARIQDANTRIAEHISRRPRSVYVDVFTPMLGQDGNPRAELFAQDGLHLSRNGYQLWQQVVSLHRPSNF